MGTVASPYSYDQPRTRTIHKVLVMPITHHHSSNCDERAAPAGKGVATPALA